MAITNPKEHAHELIERLPPVQVAGVVGLLEAMLDPVSLAIANAPSMTNSFQRKGMAHLIELRTG
jgi:hypothetical protein